MPWILYSLTNEFQLRTIMWKQKRVLDILHTAEVVGFLALGAGRSDANEGNFPTTAVGLGS